MTFQGFGLSRLSIVTLLLWGTFLPGCYAEPEPLAKTQADVGSCSLDLADDNDKPAITATLNAEGQRVVAQDINALMQLWAEDGRVVDANHTPDNPQDDQTWQGSDAIRNRYVRWVFPGAPTHVQPTDLVINITGDQATVISTTRIGDEVSPGGDRWLLSNHQGCWVIQELTFNLENP